MQYAAQCRSSKFGALQDLTEKVTTMKQCIDDMENEQSVTN